MQLSSFRCTGSISSKTFTRTGRKNGDRNKQVIWQRKTMPSVVQAPKLWTGKHTERQDGERNQSVYKKNAVACFSPSENLRKIPDHCQIHYSIETTFHLITWKVTYGFTDRTTTWCESDTQTDYAAVLLGDRFASSVNGLANRSKICRNCEKHNVVLYVVARDFDAE